MKQDRVRMPVGDKRKLPTARTTTALTERQRRYLELLLNPPFPSAAKCARLAGYSEWVARRATVIIEGSPVVRKLIAQWNRLDLARIVVEVRRRRKMQEGV